MRGHGTSAGQTCRASPASRRRAVRPLAARGGVVVSVRSLTLPPVMTQWVVYAIRNLTEDNSQNQDLIASMEEQGLVDASLLKKMGFEVEKRGGRLVLKSVRDAPPPVGVRGEPRPRSAQGAARFSSALAVTRFLPTITDGSILPSKMARKAPHRIAKNFLSGFMLLFS